jgi:hypothetical protein
MDFDFDAFKKGMLLFACTITAVVFVTPFLPQQAEQQPTNPSGTSVC